MMGELKKSIEKFLDDCRYMRGLSEKTLKAYTIQSPRTPHYDMNSSHKGERS